MCSYCSTNVGGVSGRGLGRPSTNHRTVGVVEGVAWRSRDSSRPIKIFVVESTFYHYSRIYRNGVPAGFIVIARLTFFSRPINPLNAEALGTEVGLSPGHIPQGGCTAAPPQFSAHVYRIFYLYLSGWIKTPLSMAHLGSGQILLDGDPSPPRKGLDGPLFSAHVYCGETVAHLSYC